MAWSVRYLETLGNIDQSGGEWSDSLSLIWEVYDLYFFTVSSTQDVTVTLRAPDQASAGPSVAYIGIGSPTPLNDIPVNATYSLLYTNVDNRSVTFTAQSGVTYWVWFGPSFDPVISVYSVLSISASGGSGGGNPWFTAGNIGSDGIRVNVYDYDDMISDKLCHIYLNDALSGEIDLSQGSSYEGYCDITGLSEGTYIITVQYLSSGEWYDLETSGGETYAVIVIGEPSPYYIASGSVDSLSIEFDVRNFGDLSYSTFTYYIQSTTTSYSDSYQNSSGIHTFQGLSEDIYEVWVTYTYNGQEYDIPNSDGGSVYITTIDLTGGGGGEENWHYEGADHIGPIRNEINVRTSISPLVGKRLIIEFESSGAAQIRLSSGADAVMFLTEQDNGYDVADGRPYDARGGKETSFTSKTFRASSGQSYIIWIKGTSASSSGSLTVIITPPVEGQEWSRQDMTGITNPDGETIRTWPTVEGTVYAIAVTFANSGSARFYSDIPEATDHPVMAWLTYEDNDINTEEGEPYGLSLASDVTGDGNYDFTYDAIASGHTYYFWMRAVSYGDDFQARLHFIPPSASPQSGGYVYIFANNGWTRAKPYIYANGQWTPATAYIYSNGAWKPTT